MSHYIQSVIVVFLLCFFIQCQLGKQKQTLEVTASAYNSLPQQTRQQGGGTITAWGDTLKAGMKSIAVSRDLIDSGLTHGTMVWIEGLEGAYTVNDKMNRRWTQKIDIYFGLDKEKARAWGKQKVKIEWYVEGE